jgi:hypothetical protein
MRHHDNAEALLMRHKLSQAIMMYNKSIMRIVYREWKMEMLREAGVRNFVNRILYRSIFSMLFCVARLYLQSFLCSIDAVLGSSSSGIS